MSWTGCHHASCKARRMLNVKGWLIILMTFSDMHNHACRMHCPKMLWSKHMICQCRIKFFLCSCPIPSTQASHCVYGKYKGLPLSLVGEHMWTDLMKSLPLYWSSVRAKRGKQRCLTLYRFHHDVGNTVKRLLCMDYFFSKFFYFFFCNQIFVFSRVIIKASTIFYAHVMAYLFKGQFKAMNAFWVAIGC